jgi:hypothetical protein
MAGAEDVSQEAGSESTPVEVVTNGESSTWTEGLGEDAMGYVENKGWTGAEQMLDSYRNLEKSMGAPADQLLHLPKTEEDTDGWNAVYAKMGRPETAEGYELTGPDMPEGALDLTPDLREWAHEAGLSQQQTASIYERYNSRLGELVTEQEQQIEEQAAADEAALKKEWGSAWDENLAAATRFRQRFGIDDATVSKLEQALGLRGVLELSAQIGRGLGEHQMPTGKEDGGQDLAFGMTPAAARAKIDDLTLDKEFMDQYLGGKPQAVARMTRLHTIGHPDEAK